MQLKINNANILTRIFVKFFTIFLLIFSEIFLLIFFEIRGKQRATWIFVKYFSHQYSCYSICYILYNIHANVLWNILANILWNIRANILWNILANIVQNILANIVWNQGQAARYMNICKILHSPIFLLIFFEIFLLMLFEIFLQIFFEIFLLIFFKIRGKRVLTWNAFSARLPKTGHLFPQNRWRPSWWWWYFWWWCQWNRWVYF